MPSDPAETGLAQSIASFREAMEVVGAQRSDAENVSGLRFELQRVRQQTAVLREAIEHAEETEKRLKDEARRIMAKVLDEFAEARLGRERTEDSIVGADGITASRVLEAKEAREHGEAVYDTVGRQLLPLIRFMESDEATMLF